MKPHISSSKSDSVKCRECQQVVKLQNYGRHLERFHQAEDSKDLRPYGVKKFSFGGLGTADVGWGGGGRGGAAGDCGPANVLGGKEISQSDIDDDDDDLQLVEIVQPALDVASHQIK